MFDGTSAQHCCDMLSRPDFVSLAHRQLGQLVGQKPSQTQRTTLFHVSKRPSPRYINIPSAGFLFTPVYICLHLFTHRSTTVPARSTFQLFPVSSSWKSVARSHRIHHCFSQGSGGGSDEAMGIAPCAGEQLSHGWEKGAVQEKGITAVISNRNQWHFTSKVERHTVILGFRMLQDALRICHIFSISKVVK